MAGKVDFFLEFIGTAPVPLTSIVRDRDVLARTLDVAAWERANQNAGGGRTLVVIKGRASENIDAHRATVIKLMMEIVNGDASQIGNFCALGASNSCSLILSVCVALSAMSAAPKLAYIGLIDATLIPFGRNPTITGVGNLQPIDAPDVSRVPGGAPFRTRLRPSVSGEFIPPPVARISGTINAFVKRQVFQLQGNWIKVVSDSPATRTADWWWTSDMAGDEVHGELLGWDNQRRRGEGTSDDAKHVNVIETEMKRLRREASQALVLF